jgi:hypothetical protein
VASRAGGCWIWRRGSKVLDAERPDRRRWKLFFEKNVKTAMVVGQRGIGARRWRGGDR